MTAIELAGLVIAFVAGDGLTLGALRMFPGARRAVRAIKLVRRLLPHVDREKLDDPFVLCRTVDGIVTLSSLSFRIVSGALSRWY